mgnify:CR=1 FL=1
MNHMASNFAPPVSIVVPVRNEQRFLTSSVAGIVGQGYPGPMEIILVVGLPTATSGFGSSRTRRARRPRP